MLKTPCFSEWADPGLNRGPSDFQASYRVWIGCGEIALFSAEFMVRNGFPEGSHPFIL